MSAFLDTLRERMTEAQRRVGETQKALHLATSAHQTALSEFTSWSTAYEAESRREGISPVSPPAPAVTPREADVEGNKTELIREIIRQHPTGITPGEIWQRVKNQLPRRNYVYAVLGRLKNSDLVSVRNGKYRFKNATKDGGETEALPIQ
jgi:hypothetical protein